MYVHRRDLSRATRSTMDGETRASRDALVGDLAEATRLPRNLLSRFEEMWHNREQPFFSRVTDDGVLELEALCELVRSLKVSSELVCRSAARVICEGGEVASFSQFVRGYAKLHSRTLKEALPFAFAVFDLDGDGILSQAEFRSVLVRVRYREGEFACAASLCLACLACLATLPHARPNRYALDMGWWVGLSRAARTCTRQDANLAMQELDAAAINRVLTTPAGKDAATGVSYDAFRYFASLTAETILATCGMCCHVRDFYVPLTPLGSEAEEAADEAAHAERLRRERERAHAPAHCRGADGSGSGSAAGDAAGGAEDGGDNPFEDPELLAALESLKTTPEERALRCKEKGNEAMKYKKAGVEKAVECYTDGLAERCVSHALNATLLSNRSAAHTTLKNWGKALADATAALELDALPEASALKACRRGASAALTLNKLEEAEALLERADRLGAGGGGAAAGELEELRRLRTSLQSRREEEARLHLAREAEAQRAREVQDAIRARGLEVRDFTDPQLRDQCLGAISGARVWYDAEGGELHWPVLLLYPEDAQSDFIQDFAEGDPISPHLVEMFGMHGEHSPPWDPQRRYAAPSLRVYAPFADPDDDAKELVHEIDVEMPLLAQLKRAQSLGYAIPGVPVLHVVVKGSDYERQFFLGRRTKAAAR